MKYFEFPGPVLVQGKGGEAYITFDKYLTLPGEMTPQRVAPSPMEAPVWRESSENADHWVVVCESLEKAKQKVIRWPGRTVHVAMPDDAFNIFKPLATRAGMALREEYMPFATAILRATSTKPKDFIEDSELDDQVEDQSNGKTEEAKA